MDELVPQGAAENNLPFYTKAEITTLVIKTEMFGFMCWENFLKQTLHALPLKRIIDLHAFYEL
jgi:hypothetical protein